jgi:flagellar basal body-associated protein FliL
VKAPTKAPKPRPTTKEPAEHLEEPLYAPLNPPMVVNFANDPDGFMQVEVQVMARDKSVIEVVKANEPAIRNALLMLYGGKTARRRHQSRGKEKLRAGDARRSAQGSSRLIPATTKWKTCTSPP